MSNQIYVATTTATVTLNGRQYSLKKNRTTVREGHPLLVGRNHMFREVEVDYEHKAERRVEQATARPGEVRTTSAVETAVSSAVSERAKKGPGRPKKDDKK